MEVKEILRKCDHTLLSQTATWAEIQAICDDGMKYHTASVCIPASYVKQAKDYVGDKLPICTVIGFPNGYDLKQSIIQNSLSHNCRLRGLPDEENARCSLWKIPN